MEPFHNQKASTWKWQTLSAYRYAERLNACRAQRIASPIRTDLIYDRDRGVNRRFARGAGVGGNRRFARRAGNIDSRHARQLVDVERTAADQCQNVRRCRGPLQIRPALVTERASLIDLWRRNETSAGRYYPAGAPPHNRHNAPHPR